MLNIFTKYKSIFNCQLSIIQAQIKLYLAIKLNCELSIVNSKLSIVNSKLKHILPQKNNCQLSIVNCTLFLTLLTHQANAQIINAGTSPQGIVLHYEGPLNGEEIKLQKGGKDLATLKLRKSEKEITEKLKEAELKLYTHPQTIDSLIPYLLQSVNKAKSTEQIFNKFLLPVKISIGLVFIDEKGKVEDLYTAKMGDKTIDVVWERKEAVFKEPAISPMKHRSWYGKIETSWTVDPANPVLYTKLFRKNHDSVLYHLVSDPVINTARRGDTVIALALDTSLKKLSYYHYQMAGYDFYGNPTKLSKMMIADNLDNSTLPVIHQFTALENAEKTQVEIKWKINFKERVKSALLFRSFKSDKNFQLITQLPPGDTIYYDNIVYPMEAVFYKLVLYDLKGLIDHAPIVPMVSKQKPDAMPPSNIDIKLVEGKPTISWEIKDLSARGFYVYRADAIGVEPIRVSAFIQADTAIQYQWSDTSKYLLPGKSYHYAIIANSKGYVDSDFSDFATIEIPDNRPLLTPHSVLARKIDHDKVLIVWNTSGPESDRPEVYNVYRSKEESGPFERINKELLFVENNFIDTLSEKANTWYYAVTSVAPNGNESAKSTPYELTMNLVHWGIRNVFVSESEEGVEIQWPSGDPEVAKVEVHRIDEKEKVEVLSTLDCIVEKYLDKNAKKGQMYGYRVVSISPKGEKSEPGNWVMLIKN